MPTGLASALVIYWGAEGLLQTAELWLTSRGLSLRGSRGNGVGSHLDVTTVSNCSPCPHHWGPELGACLSPREFLGAGVAGSIVTPPELQLVFLQERLVRLAHQHPVPAASYRMDLLCARHCAGPSCEPPTP